MKVILQKDVPKLGRRSEVKEVPDGYARNFLLPNRLAEIATPEALHALSKIETMKRVEKEVAYDLLLKNAKELDGTTLILTEKANEKGHLFSGIHKKEIVDGLLKFHRISISEDSILLDEPIRTVGEQTIPISIGSVKAKIRLKIEPAK